MELTILSKGIPETEPKMRIYGHYVSFNAAAVRLLGINDGDYIQFAKPSYGFRKELYVRKASTPGGSYIARKRRQISRISSASLLGLLQENGFGKGCYRICPEVTVDDKDGTYYNIFFRNYDKKDTD